MTKATRVRRKPQEIVKTTLSGKMKKISYLMEQPGTVEFNPPEMTHGNRMLSNHEPLQKVDETGKLDPDGKLGSIKGSLFRLRSIKK